MVFIQEDTNKKIMGTLDKLYKDAAKSGSIRAHINKELRDFDSLAELLIDLAESTDVKGVREVGEQLPHKVEAIIKQLQEKIEHESHKE